MDTHIKKTQFTASVCTKICHFSSTVGQKWPFFCQQLSFLAKKYQFRAQISVSWVWVVSWCPRYPILRVLVSKEDVLHAIEAISQLFQGHQHQKTPIFAQKMAKKYQFWAQISVV